MMDSIKESGSQIAKSSGTMIRRSGATLVEVLVSIFIMGIGLLALLTLFPIGVLTMAQAIQDDRTAHALENALGIARMTNLKHDPNLEQWFRNPDPTIYSDATSDGPSYPVFVDAVGRSNNSGGYLNWVANQPAIVSGGSAIPRVDPSFVKNSIDTYRFFTSLDDPVFGEDGTPKIVSTNAAGNNLFERKSVFSWAYLLQRPVLDQPSVVEMKVVVYSNRPLTLNKSAQPDESLYVANFDMTASLVTLTWDPSNGEVPPSLRLGDWILDSTPVNGKSGPPHANFYRVVGINQTSNSAMDIEVQTPLHGFPANQATNAGYVVIMDGVVEVFHVRAQP
jgi:type II secretory pathway pseudopilin PulG